MSTIKTNNLEELLDKDKVVDLFLKYQKECGLTYGFEIKKIDRLLVLSPKTYAMLYTLLSDKTIRKIRLNASNEETRERSYAVMKYLQPQFLGPQFFIPKAYFYDLDYNAICYENVEGSLLIKQLKDSNLEKLIELTALWLKHLHSINKPDLVLPKHEIFYNFEALRKFYPDLAQDGQNIVDTLKSSITYDFKEVLTHGDYQPNNIIVDAEKIAVFDFNDSQIGDSGLDIAKFITQLKVMLFRFADKNKFTNLENVFFKYYDLDFHKGNFRIYIKMYYLQILCSLSASLAENSEAQKTIPEVYKYWEEENRA